MDVATPVQNGWPALLGFKAVQGSEHYLRCGQEKRLPGIRATAQVGTNNKPFSPAHFTWRATYRPLAKSRRRRITLPTSAGTPYMETFESSMIERSPLTCPKNMAVAGTWSTIFLKWFCSSFCHLHPSVAVGMRRVEGL